MEVEKDKPVRVAGAAEVDLVETGAVDLTGTVEPVESVETVGAESADLVDSAEANLSEPVEPVRESRLEYVTAQIGESEKREKLERPRRKRRRWGLCVGVVLAVIALAAGVALVLNREWVYDFYLGTTYTPSREMARIRDDLKLTERGEFIFNAAQPELNEAEAFNSYCRTETDVENAVLGCYTVGRIYVYNIVDAELEGIRELTAAHELLHAVWARMTEQERVALVTELTQVFEANQDALGSEIETYDVAARQEELYVRAGTEIANLPAGLEKHYAEIFEDQDRIAGFYDSYIAVFREIEAEMAGLVEEMDSISEEIDTKSAEYEEQLGQLDADIVSFNACAAVEGCIKSESEFYARRNALISRQEELGVLYEEINALIGEYNELVAQYNEDVTRNEKLNQKINSNQKVEAIE